MHHVCYPITVVIDDWIATGIMACLLGLGVAAVIWAWCALIETIRSK